MDELTMELYRDYLIKRIDGLTKLIERYENDDCITKDEADMYMRAYAALDDVMERLFVLDNVANETE